MGRSEQRGNVLPLSLGNLSEIVREKNGGECGDGKKKKEKECEGSEGD